MYGSLGLTLYRRESGTGVSAHTKRTKHMLLVCFEGKETMLSRSTLSLQYYGVSIKSMKTGVVCEVVKSKRLLARLDVNTRDRLHQAQRELLTSEISTRQRLGCTLAFRGFHK